MKDKRNSSAFFLSALCLIVLLLSITAMLCACVTTEQPAIAGPMDVEPTSSVAETASPTDASTEPPTEPTEPSPTCPPDGDPEDITCQGSYTAGKMELSKNSQTVVATAGKHKLTSGLLQIYYQAAVNAYQEEGHENAPDFEQGLDTQLRDLEGTTVTWQVPSEETEV